MDGENEARVREILATVKPLAAEYYRLTGKPLGVTGEVAEDVAAEILGMRTGLPQCWWCQSRGCPREPEQDDDYGFPPRKANHRAGFLESDRIRTLDLPQDECLLTCAKSIESVMKVGTSADVRRTCVEFLDAASDFYRAHDCGVRVLAARPLRVRENWSSELFGDYTPMLIRVWMRTAVRKEITSFGTFLSTLCHEFCHHAFSSKHRAGLLLKYQLIVREATAGCFFRNAIKASVIAILFWR